MKSKLLIVQQFFGCGDICFGQTIANDFIKEGYKVLYCIAIVSRRVKSCLPKSYIHRLQSCKSKLREQRV